MAASKISVYSLPDLKNTTDDALPNYLNSLKFQQSHFLTDVRLGLGYFAVVIAGLTFYLDYKRGWDETKDYTFWAVIAYFILNSILTIWIWGMERGKVFVGALDDSLITMASSVTKHTPIYRLTVRQSEHSKRPPFVWRSKEISAPFTRWFTADGYFVAEPFQRWLAEEVEMIAAARERQGKTSVGAVPETVGASMEEPRASALDADQSPTKRVKRGKK